MKVWIKKNKMYFDKEAYELFMVHARRTHKTFKQTVHAAIRRGIKRAEKKGLL